MKNWTERASELLEGISDDEDWRISYSQCMNVQDAKLIIAAPGLLREALEENRELKRLDEMSNATISQLKCDRQSNNKMIEELAEDNERLKKAVEVLSEQKKELELRVKRMDNEEIIKSWQEISASAHDRLKEAIEHIGECQNPIGSLGCGECIWCMYYD